MVMHGSQEGKCLEMQLWPGGEGQDVVEREGGEGRQGVVCGVSSGCLGLS